MLATAHTHTQIAFTFGFVKHLQTELQQQHQKKTTQELNIKVIKRGRSTKKKMHMVTWHFKNKIALNVGTGGTTCSFCSFLTFTRFCERIAFFSPLPRIQMKTLFRIFLRTIFDVHSILVCVCVYCIFCCIDIDSDWQLWVFQFSQMQSHYSHLSLSSRLQTSQVQVVVKFTP